MQINWQKFIKNSYLMIVVTTETVELILKQYIKIFLTFLNEKYCKHNMFVLYFLDGGIYKVFS